MYNVLIPYSSQYETTEAVKEEHVYEGVKGGMLVFLYLNVQ